MSYRFFQVTVAEQNDDIRWDSLTDRRNGTAGLGWSYTSLIRARNKTEAEKLFRAQKRFRKTARQNDADWRTVFVLIERVTKAQGIS